MIADDRDDTDDLWCNAPDRMQDCKIIYERSSKEFFGVFSVCCSVWQNWGKESEGGWVALSRRALSPTTLLNFLFKSGSNLNLWPINLEMVCGSGCPDFGSLGLSINPLLLSCF